MVKSHSTLKVVEMYASVELCVGEQDNGIQSTYPIHTVDMEAFPKL